MKSAGREVACSGGLTANTKFKGAENLMKKLIACLIILFISCASNQAQFRETDNMTYLKFGSYSLGIDKRFELMGTLDSDFHKENFDKAKGSQIKSTGYVFADTGAGDKSVKRSLIVYDNQLKDTQQFWRNEISYENANVKGKVDSGVVKVGNINMAYMILEANPNLDPAITRVIKSKGAGIDRDFQNQAHISMIYYGKLIGPTRNILVIYIDVKENTELAFNESLNFLTLER